MWLLQRLLIAVANPPFALSHFISLLLHHLAFWLSNCPPPPNSPWPHLLLSITVTGGNTCRSWSGISSCLVMMIIWGCAQSGSQTDTTVKRIICCCQGGAFLGGTLPYFKRVRHHVRESQRSLNVCGLFFNLVSLLHLIWPLIAETFPSFSLIVEIPLFRQLVGLFADIPFETRLLWTSQS